MLTAGACLTTPHRRCKATPSTRRAGELTQFYAHAPAGLRRSLHRLNRVWFSRIQSPSLALGNLFVFKRS